MTVVCPVHQDEHLSRKWQTASTSCLLAVFCLLCINIVEASIAFTQSLGLELLTGLCQHAWHCCFCHLHLWHFKKGAGPSMLCCADMGRLNYHVDAKQRWEKQKAEQQAFELFHEQVQSCTSNLFCVKSSSVPNTHLLYTR